MFPRLTHPTLIALVSSTPDLRQVINRWPHKINATRTPAIPSIDLTTFGATVDSGPFCGQARNRLNAGQDQPFELSGDRLFQGTVQ